MRFCMSRLAERVENFNKAYSLFEQTRNVYVSNPTNDIYKLALTQSFEIVFELGWKVLKDELHLKGIDVFAPRDAIKEAFSANILPNAQVWIDMLSDRNSSTHEYNQEKVDKIVNEISSTYFEELTNFYNRVHDFNE